MDFIYHIGTGLAVSKGLTGKYILSSAFFATLPDIIGSTPHQYIKAKRSSKESFKKFASDWMQQMEDSRFYGDPDRELYRYTHSFLTLIPVYILARILTPNFWIVSLTSYASHLIIDIFTHDKEFSQKPFYPLSKWSIEGRSWWHDKRIFSFFWILLLAVLIVQKYI